MAAPPKIPRRDFYVYVLFRETGQPFYVGKGQGNRVAHHTIPSNLKTNSHKNSIIKRTIVILGEVPIIKVSEHLTESEAFDLEIELIKAIGRRPSGPLANKTAGGEGLREFMFTPELREKIAAPQRGVPRPYSAEVGRRPEVRAKIAATLTGRTRPKEVGQKTAAALRGRKVSPERHAKMHSPEARAKQWETRKRLREEAIAAGIPVKKNNGNRTKQTQAVKDALAAARARPEVRKKRSESLKRSPKVAAQIERLAIINRGTKRSPEVIETLKRAWRIRKAKQHAQ